MRKRALKELWIVFDDDDVIATGKTRIEASRRASAYMNWHAPLYLKFREVPPKPKGRTRKDAEEKKQCAELRAEKGGETG